MKEKSRYRPSVYCTQKSVCFKLKFFIIKTFILKLMFKNHIFRLSLDGSLFLFSGRVDILHSAEATQASTTFADQPQQQHHHYHHRHRPGMLTSDDRMRSTSSSVVLSGRSSDSDSPPPKVEVRVKASWDCSRVFAHFCYNE